ncbi:hypothetical protein [Streptomyces avicenniae]|uniref:hypothetical protein n=1 Tax=Streptomyces avicenniae TaxID=500153 RepID=UPI0006995A93|nr:hypothetical protein [Streptomyces avicenniae]
MAQRVHRPGLPGDLSGPRRLWARAATLGLLATAGIGGDTYEATGDRLRCVNPDGSYWWTLTLHGGGRAVFSGQDADGSQGHLRAEPVELLATAPSWLPQDELRARQTARELGYVYWSDGAGWARAPYPDDLADDGLELSAGWVGDDEEVAEELWDAAGGGDDMADAVLAFLDRAETRTVDADAVKALLDACSPKEPPSVEAALGFAVKARLTPGA